MSAVHDFKDSLARSQSYSNASWWIDTYRKAFPTLCSCVEVRNDGWAQRAGIDRVLTLGCGKVVKVDEKVRETDYGDILLEYWSNFERRVHGWVNKPLDCDFIAYAIVPTETCYLLPTLLLQKAWRENGRDWCELGIKHAEGFRKVVAKNEGYETHSVAVPVDRLMSGITGAISVKWSAQ